MPDQLNTKTKAVAEAGEKPGAQAGAVGEPAAQDEWDRLNQRRSELISKEFSTGLTPDEASELAALQSELEQRLDALAPLSFDAVDELAEVVRKVEARRRETVSPGPKSS